MTWMPNILCLPKTALEPFIVPLSESIVRDAGSLRYRAGRPLRDTIDAIVVATSDVFAGSDIRPGDASDMMALATLTHRSHVIGI